MPEYLHPGVYIEEYDAHPKAIPGVETSTDEFVVRTLANEIAQIDAASLLAEQDYHREKRRRQHRALHGVGIVDGLGVGVEPGGGAEHGRIRSEPGYAIDPCGEEIVLDQGAVLPLPRTGDPIWVTLRHWDRPCSPPPSAAQAEPMHSRIEDACIVSLTGAFASPAIAVARLHASASGWVVDAAFTSPRVSRRAG
jgi:hypothetical protein